MTPVKLAKGVTLRIEGRTYVGEIPAHCCPKHLLPKAKEPKK
jgi:hypothetical protein